MSTVCSPEMATISMEFAATMASAASAGADRLRTRRTSAAGRTTVGRPRLRNHRSAA